MRIRTLCVLTAVILPLSACESINKFSNSNLQAVQAKSLVIPPRPVVQTATARAAAATAATTLETLAGDISTAVNRSADFQAAGVSAAPTSNSPTVTFTYDAHTDFAWSGSALTAGGAKATEQFKFVPTKSGTTTLTLSGTVATGDKVTVLADTNIKDAIAGVANQSQVACANFLGGLVLAETSTNVGFDLASTVTSALATVFKPLSTVHSLTASTTILTGSKTAINADIYAKASIANFATAIQATYYTDMGKYVDGLAAADASTLDWQIEVYKISVIHDECGLAPAEASIAATLQKAQSQPAATQPSPITVNTSGTDTALDKLAQDLANQINNSADFKKAGVTAATPASLNATTYTIDLSYPSSTSISWTATAKGAVGHTAAEQPSVATTATGARITLSLPTGSVASGDVVTLTGTPATPAPTTTPGGSTPPSSSPGRAISH